MRNNRLRILFSLLGVILIGIAIAFLRIADLGTDPFTTFNLGFSSWLGMRFGTFLILSNALMLIFVFFIARKYIGLGTIFNILLVGNLSDLILSFLQNSLGSIDALGIRVVVSLLSIVLLACGAALYIAADLGVAPYDALPVIAETKSNGRLSFQVTRITLDMLCAIVGGFFFEATLGVSTIIIAFFMGPLIQFFRTRFQQLLKKMEQAS